MTCYQNSATQTDASYTYDASGQRTKSDVTVGSSETVTNFSYDGLALMKLSATRGSDSWRLDYLYDEEGVPYAGIYRSPSDSTSPTTFTMITNNHGDVLELLDANGDAFASYRYDPWGSAAGLGHDDAVNESHQLRPRRRYRRPPGATLRRLCLRRRERPLLLQRALLRPRDPAVDHGRLGQGRRGGECVSVLRGGSDWGG
jgi:hypothetical protein